MLATIYTPVKQDPAKRPKSYTEASSVDVEVSQVEDALDQGAPLGTRVIVRHRGTIHYLKKTSGWQIVLRVHQ